MDINEIQAPKENVLIKRPSLSGNNTLPNDRELAVVAYHRNSDGVWMYEVEVTGSGGILSRYIIRRRYSDFKTLYDSLIEAYGEGTLTLPTFPRGGIWGFIKVRGAMTKVLENRRVAFDALLKRIQAIPITRYSPAFSAFLGHQPFSKTGSARYINLREYASGKTAFSSEIEERRNIRKSSKAASFAATASSTESFDLQNVENNFLQSA